MTDFSSYFVMLNITIPKVKSVNKFEAVKNTMIKI